MDHRTRHHPCVPTAAVLACLLFATGCGGGEEALEEPVSLHQLDPPHLASFEFVDDTPGVPVLCYHYFRADFDPDYLARVVGSLLFGLPALGDREFWTTPRAELARHLEYFRNSGIEVVTLDEVADLNAANKPLPTKAVILTIDDADRSVYELAWPLLQEYGVRAHLFVPTGEAGRAWSDLDVCSWAELAEMAASGHVLVESHTRSLHFKVRTTGDHEPVFWHPGAIPAEVAAANRAALGEGTPLPPSGPWQPVLVDLAASRFEIARHVGRSPRWLAWPYGFATADLDSLARDLGFRGTVSLRPSRFTAADTSCAVGRVTLTAKTTLDQLSGIFPVRP
ncbi:MAG: polysaccharide deacetylase family protein [bacterium]|nr:polysaccharide deacetylase family protein [bacterium]